MAKTILTKAPRFFFLILLLSASVFACADRAFVYGQVTSGDRPVYRATVTAGGKSVLTNPFGYYTMLIPNCGTYHVTASAKWYTFTTEDLFLPIADTNVIEVDFVAE